MVLGLGAIQARLADGDFVQQLSKLPVAAGLGSELAPILARVPRAQLFHPPAAAVGQKVKFLFSLVDARNFVYQVADLPIYRVSRFAAPGGNKRCCSRLRNGGHFAEDSRAA